MRENSSRVSSGIQKSNSYITNKEYAQAEAVLHALIDQFGSKTRIWRQIHHMNSMREAERFYRLAMHVYAVAKEARTAANMLIETAKDLGKLPHLRNEVGRWLLEDSYEQKDIVIKLKEMRQEIDTEIRKIRDDLRNAA